MLKRYLYRLYRVTSAVNFWSRRRCTGAGFLVLGALLFTAAVGIDTSFTMAYQGLVLLFLLLAVSFLWASVSRPKLQAERILPKFATVEVPMPYEVVVRNPARRVQRSLSIVEELPDARPTLHQFLYSREPGEEKRNWFDRFWGFYRWRWLLRKNVAATGASLPVPALSSREESELPHELVPRKRGVLRLGNLLVTAPDPFGLFQSVRRVPCAQSVLVLPKRYPLPAFDLPGSMRYQQGGVALASSVGQSEEFVALRDYRPGDPLRHIHWRSWAKADKPIIKEFQDEFFCRYALVLDTFGRALDEDIFEEAVSVAASFACTIPDQDSLLDLMFVGPEAFCFTAGRGLAYPEQMLEILASVSLCSDKAFDELERLVSRHISAVSGCVLVLLNWDEARQQFAEQLKSMGVPVMVFVITKTDGRDSANADAGPTVNQPARFHRLECGKIAEALVKL